jgi:uncharacterized protein
MEPTNAIKPGDTVFVDTAAWIALVVKHDSLHKQSMSVMTKLKSNNAKLITSESVLFEFANALSALKYRAKAIAFIDSIRSLPNVEIVFSDYGFFEKSLSLYRERNDKEWSLTDCSSFEIMSEKEISHAFTSDKHFEQAGFVKLLSA